MSDILLLSLGSILCMIFGVYKSTKAKPLSLKAFLWIYGVGLFISAVFASTALILAVLRV